MFGAHAEGFIGILRPGVLCFHIEPQSCNILFFSQMLYMTIHIPENTPAAVFRDHINRLEPPYHAVAPVAPLVRDKKRCNHGAVILSATKSSPLPVIQIYVSPLVTVYSLSFISSVSHAIFSWKSITTSASSGFAFRIEWYVLY